VLPWVQELAEPAQHDEVRLTTISISQTTTRASQAAQSPRSAIVKYRAQAEEYRFQAETFRDPKAQAQVLHLAAIYDRKAVQAEEGGH